MTRALEWGFLGSVSCSLCLLASAGCHGLINDSSKKKIELPTRALECGEEGEKKERREKMQCSTLIRQEKRGHGTLLLLNKVARPHVKCVDKSNISYEMLSPGRNKYHR